VQKAEQQTDRQTDTCTSAAHSIMLTSHQSNLHDATPCLFVKHSFTSHQSNLHDVTQHQNTLLLDEEIEMLVVLRMNESFMRHMREHYSQYAKHAFNMTIVND
jgi:hypothetical protein